MSKEMLEYLVELTLDDLAEITPRVTDYDIGYANGRDQTASYILARLCQIHGIDLRALKAYTRSLMHHAVRSGHWPWRYDVSSVVRSLRVAA